MRTPFITIEEAVSLLQKGEIVAFPTETVYGLGALASHSEAIAKIYQVKGRELSKQLLLHVADLKTVNPFVMELPPLFDLLADAFLPGPLTLIVKAEANAIYPNNFSSCLGIASTIGIRMPSHPIAQHLIRSLGAPLFATSANRSGSRSPITAFDVLEELDGRIAGVIDGGAAVFGVASTIIDLSGPSPRLIREGAIEIESIRKILETQCIALE